MELRTLFLPVNNITGVVDYMYVEYDLRAPPLPGEHDLIEGWDWKPFKVVPASPASVPEGYVVVPVEPTEEMKLAWVSHKSFDGCYKAMLAAAPTPPVSEDRKDAERYRWLRSIGGQVWHMVDDPKYPVKATDEYYDSVVDQAMQEGK